MMASIGDSGSLQYRVFQPLPNGLSNKQHSKHLQDVDELMATAAHQQHAGNILTVLMASVKAARASF